MEDPTRSCLGLDRNVLFGRAALHLGLVTSEQLRAAMIELVDAGDRSLSQVLMDQGVLELEQVLRVLDAIGDDAGEAATHEPKRARAAPGAARQPLALELQELQQAARRYRVGDQIGAGGMGSIVQVTDRVLQRDVVMKQLLPGARSSALKVQRFIQEARVTSRLEHPNIVPVHELGVTEQGEVYFTMKRVAGEDLGQVVERLQARDPQYTARYSLTRRLVLFQQICHAVAFAHSRGVVHRDLKPDNVMIGAFGELLVMDWGLARVEHEPEAESGATGLDDTLRQAADLSLTLEGQVIGTPCYMAPEQARGQTERLDARTDIYSLGAILLELLVLRPPFEIGNLFELLVSVAQGRFTPPGEAPGDPPVPRELAAVVCKAMATDPAARYQSVPELNEDIEAFLSGRSVSARRDPLALRLFKWARRHKAATAGLAAGLVALALGISGVLAYERMRTRTRFRELLDSASTHLAASNYTAAEADSTRALFLDPESRIARRLGRQAAVGLDRQRQRKALSRRIAELSRRFEQEDRATGNVSHAAPAMLGRWYAAHTALLATGQELLRLAPEQTLVRIRTTSVALELARQLEREASWEMARLMIEQAAELGLSGAQRKSELERLDRARSARRRAEIERVLQILADLASKPPEEGMVEEHVLELAKMPRSHVVRLLIPAVFAGGEWQRRVAIAALGKIGDRATTGPIPPDALRTPPAPVADRHHQFVLHTKHRELSAAGVEGLDPVRALCLRLLHVSPERMQEEAVALVWALGRLRDHRAFLIVHHKRRAARAHSVFWQRTHLPLRRLPIPELAGRADWWLHYSRGNFLESQGRLEVAIEAFSRAAKLAPDQPAIFVGRGQAYMAHGQLAHARNDFERALRLDPRSAAAFNGRGRVRRQQGDLDGAIADHTRAIGLAPGDPDPLNNRGLARRTKGDLAGARADYDHALRIAPRASYVYVNRAAARKAAGDIAGALADLDRAIEFDPREVQALLDRALIRREQQRDSQGALADCDRAIALRPGDYRAYVTRGQTRLMLERFAGAIADLDKALELMPKDAKVRPRILQLRRSAMLLKQSRGR